MIIEIEYWKDIIYNDKYQVSSLGEVRNKETGKILKPKINRQNYHEVKFRVDGILKGFRLNRLVAIHFIPNDNPDRIEVNHINAIHEDNNVSNLEWVTPEENLAHARELGLLSYPGEMNPNAKFTDDMVRCICELLSQNKSYDDIQIHFKDNSKEFRKLILKVKSRESWNHISKDYGWDTSKMTKGKFKKYSKEIYKLVEEGIDDTMEIKRIIGLDHLKGRDKTLLSDFIGSVRRRVRNRK